MAKSLLLNALLGVLGDYVDGLSPENLKLGVWSGEVELDHLQLKREGIKKLGLPLDVSAGYVERLALKIPWAHLESQPVSVEIDGVFLTALPLDKSAVDTAAVKERLRKTKMAELGAADAELATKQRKARRRKRRLLREQMEAQSPDGGEAARRRRRKRQKRKKKGKGFMASLWGRGHDDDDDDDDSDSDSDLSDDDDLSGDDGDEEENNASGGDSYVERLTTKIVDNIELTIRNIHVRYEDDTLVPGHTIAAGIVLDSLLIRTVDENGEVRFVTREKQERQGTTVRKVLHAQNFATYWSCQADSVAQLNPEAWKQTLLSMIPRSDQQQQQQQPQQLQVASPPQSAPLTRQWSTLKTSDFILAPCALTVRLLHNEVAVEDEPKFTANIEGTHINLRVAKQQYNQVLQTTSALQLLGRWHDMSPFRPTVRPTENPRAWWLYAVNFVLNRPPGTAALADRAAKGDILATMQLLRGRKRYIALHRRLLHDAEHGLSHDEREEYDAIEAEFPNTALLIFRQFARHEHYVERAARKAEAKAKAEAEARATATAKAVSRTKAEAKTKAEADARTKAAEADAQAAARQRATASTTSAAHKPKKSGDRHRDDDSSSGWGGFLSRFGGGKKKKASKERDQHDDGHTEPPSSTAVDRHMPAAEPAAQAAAAEGYGPAAEAVVQVVAEDSETSAAAPAISVDDDVDLVQITDTLASMAENDFATHPHLLRLNASSGSTLTLVFDDQELLSAGLSWHANLDIRASGTRAELFVPHVVVEDLCTPNAVFRQLVRVKHDADDAHFPAPFVPNNPSGEREKPPLLHVRMENIPHQTPSLLIEALPVEVVWNKPCIQQTLGFLERDAMEQIALLTSNTIRQRIRQAQRQVAAGERHVQDSDDEHDSGEQNQVENEGVSKERESETEGAHVKSAELHIRVRAAAPKFIIPEAWDNPNTGMLLLDNGAFHLDGDIGPNGMSWRVRMTGLQAALPLSYAESSVGARAGGGPVADERGQRGMQVLQRHDRTQVVHPFDVALNVQNVDRTEADTNVSIVVEPEIRMVVDPPRLQRLLGIMDVFRTTFLHDDHVANMARAVSDADDDSNASLIAADPGSHAQRRQQQQQQQQQHQQQQQSGQDSVTAALRAAKLEATEASAALSSIVHSTAAATGDQGAVEADALTFAKLATLKGSVDPLHTTVAITARMPAAILVLDYGGWLPSTKFTELDQRYHLTLQIQDMQTAVRQRPYDTIIKTDLANMSFSDGARPAGKQDMISSSACAESLISTTLTVVDDAASPEFDGYGLMLDATFTSIDVNCDPDSLMHLKPFCDILLLYRVLASEAANERVEAVRSLVGTEQTEDAAAADNATTASTALVASADHHHLAAVDDDVGHRLPGVAIASVAANRVDGVHGVGQPTGVRVRASLVHASAELMNRVAGSTTGEIASVVSLHVWDLGSEISVKTGVAASMSLRAVEVSDSRPSSSTHFYRKLVSSALVQDMGQGDHPSFGVRASPLTEVKEEEGDGARSPSSGGSKEHQVSASLPHHETDASVGSVLSAKFSSSEDGEVDLTLIMQDIVSYVSLDAIFDIIDAATATADALNAILIARFATTEGTVPMDREDQEAVRQQRKDAAQERKHKRVTSSEGRSPRTLVVGSGDEDAQQQQQQQQQDQAGQAPSDTSTMSVRLHVLRPRVILLEDPALPTTKAVVATASFDVMYAKETRWLDGDSENQAPENQHVVEHVHVSAMDLQSSVSLDLSDEEVAPLEVLDPLSMNLSLVRKSEANQTLSVKVGLDCDNVDARVSVNDLLLVKSILIRTATARSSKQAMEQATEAELAREAAAAQQEQLQQLQELEKRGGAVARATAAVMAGGAMSAQAGPAASSGTGDGTAAAAALTLGTTPLTSPLLYPQTRGSPRRTDKKEGEEEEEEEDARNKALTPIKASGLGDASSLQGTALEPWASTVFRLDLSCGHVRVVMINDWDGQNIPLIRAQVNEIISTVDGVVGNVVGEASFMVRADFFNPTVFQWEPVLEPWKPQVSIAQPTSVDRLEETPCIANVNVTSENLELTLSGACLQTVMETQSLLLRETSKKSERSRSSACELRNDTGMPLELRLPGGSQAEPHLVTVAPGEHTEFSLSRYQSAQQKRARAHAMLEGAEVTGAIPKKLVHLSFGGEVGQGRRAVQVPVTGTAVRKVVPLQLTNPSVTEQRFHGSVVDEVWEYQRFHPLRRKWVAPYMPTDPPAFADEAGENARKPEQEQCPSGWAWTDEWHVDVTSRGVVGSEVDQEGFDYALDFQGFRLTRTRRLERMGDMARRRRLVRTRTRLDTSSADASTRPLTMVWELATTWSGRSVIHAGSTLRIQNSHTFPIVLAFSGPGWSEECIVGPVDVDDTIAVPVAAAHATKFRVRPAPRDGVQDAAFNWSDHMVIAAKRDGAADAGTASAAVRARRHVHPLSKTRANATGGGSSDLGLPNEEEIGAVVRNMTILCVPTNPTTTAAEAGTDAPDADRNGRRKRAPRVVPSVLVCNQMVCDAVLTLQFAPPLVVYNWLPTPLICRVRCDDPSADDTREIPPGTEMAMATAALEFGPRVSFRIDTGYGWSQEIDFAAVALQHRGMHGGAGSTSRFAQETGARPSTSAAATSSAKSHGGDSSAGEVDATRDSVAPKGRSSRAAAAAASGSGRGRSSTTPGSGAESDGADMGGSNSTAAHGAAVARRFEETSFRVNMPSHSSDEAPLVLLVGNRGITELAPELHVHCKYWVVDRTGFGLVLSPNTSQEKHRRTLHTHEAGAHGAVSPAFSDVSSPGLIGPGGRPTTAPRGDPQHKLLAAAASGAAAAVGSQDTGTGGSTDSAGAPGSVSGQSGGGVRGSGGLLADLSVKASTHPQLSAYTVSPIENGKRIYMDRDYEWSNVPSWLTHSACLVTANDDKTVAAGRDFLSFTVAHDDTVVYVLYDARARSPAQWMRDRGFRRMQMEFTAVTSKAFRTVECPFVLYARVFAANSTVTLGGNDSENSGGGSTMYTVCVRRLAQADRQLFARSKVALPPSSTPPHGGADGSGQGMASSLSDSARAGSERGSTWRDRLTEEKQREAEDKARLRDLLQQQTEEEYLANQHDVERAMASWAHGGAHVSLFSAEGDEAMYISSTVMRGWSERLDIHNPQEKGVFVAPGTHGEELELALSVRVLPAGFKRSRLVTVMPRYCFVNLTGSALHVRQAEREGGAPQSPDTPEGELILEHNSHAPWHWLNAGRPRTVLLRCGYESGSSSAGGDEDNMDDSEWTEYGVDISELGSNVVCAFRKGFPHNPLVLHVEVKLATREEECAVLVVVWKVESPSLAAGHALFPKLATPGQRDREDIAGRQRQEAIVASAAAVRIGDTPLYVVRNDHPTMAAVLRQSQVNSRCEFKVPCGATVAIGWANPAAKQKMEVTLVDTGCSATVKMSTVGKCAQITLKSASKSSSSAAAAPAGAAAAASGNRNSSLSTRQSGAMSSAIAGMVGKGAFSSGDGEAVLAHLTVVPRGSSRVLRITLGPLSSEGDASWKERNRAHPPLRWAISIKSIVCSMVSEFPVRRELFALGLNHAACNVTHDMSGRAEVELTVQDVQVDNHTPDGIYPVIMRADESTATARREAGESPFFHFVLIRRAEGAHATTVVEYVAIRLLAMEVFLDSRAIEHLIVFLDPIKLVDVAEAVAARDPASWLREFILDTVVQRSYLRNRAALEGSRSQQVLTAAAASTAAAGSFAPGDKVEALRDRERERSKLVGYTVRQQLVHRKREKQNSGLLAAMRSRSPTMAAAIVSGIPPRLAGTPGYYSPSVSAAASLSESEVESDSDGAPPSGAAAADSSIRAGVVGLLCCYVDVPGARASALASKRYIEQLVLHPIKATVTLVQLPSSVVAPIGVGNAMVDVLRTLASVDRAPFALTSFLAEHIMETPETLVLRILSHFRWQLARQVLALAGSLSALGSPVGLVHNIGEGVSDLFYEPLQGFVVSPQEFVLGIGRGASSLVQRVVSGALNSAAGIVDSASKNIAMLSADKEYMEQRQMSRHRAQAERGGVVDGFLKGGESIARGVGSGLAGLVLDPMREAKQGGAMGFVKGMGKGVLGVAVKPVLGVTDGVSSVVQGISNTVSNADEVRHFRPRRALEHHPENPVPKVVPYNILAAQVQQLLENELNDTFAQCTTVLSSAEESMVVIFGERHIMIVTLLSPAQLQEIAAEEESSVLPSGWTQWRNQKRWAAQWTRRWRDVAYCEYLGEGVGLHLYDGADAAEAGAESPSFADSLRKMGGSMASTEHRRSGGGGSADDVLKVLSCGRSSAAMQLYAKFVAHSFRMGNPTRVVPLEELLHSSLSSSPSMGGSSTDAEAFRTLERKWSSMSSMSDIDGYRFGLANTTGAGQQQRVQRMSDNAFQQFAAQELAQVGMGDWEALDVALWRCVRQFDANHSGMRMARCALLCVINQSETHLQIHGATLADGVDWQILGGVGYDEESRTVQPSGGAIAIIAWGFTPSPIKTGHVKLAVDTSACNITVASRRKHVSCGAKQGFTVGFLERSVEAWWSKFVALVR